jgi:hypothetical protein
MQFYNIFKRFEQLQIIVTLVETVQVRRIESTPILVYMWATFLGLLMKDL